MYSLGDLLPYAGNTRLNSLQNRIRVLELVEFLCKSAKNSVLAFLSKQYNAFDAQVSENLCQIRAYQLTYILDNYDEDCFRSLSLFYQNIKDVQTRCRVLTTEYKELSTKRPSYYVKKIDQTVTLTQMLERHDLNIKLAELPYLLTQNYILSTYKLTGAHNISQGIDYEKLCHGLNIASKTLARKVACKLQRNISKNSCQFIFRLANELNLTLSSLDLLRALYSQDEVGRHLLASYEVTRIILQHAFKVKKHIKITVHCLGGDNGDVITFFLKPSRFHKHYVVSKKIKKYANNSLISFSGITCASKHTIKSRKKYIAQFMHIGFEDVLLANMAQHPQYAGILLDAKKFNPYSNLDINGRQQQYLDVIKQSEQQFLNHKNLSAKIGCNAENFTLFLLTHVRCDYTAPRQHNVYSHIHPRRPTLYDSSQTNSGLGASTLAYEL